MTRRIAVGLAALALLLSLPHAASAEEEEHTECANYISSSDGDEPMTGTLLGSRTVTRTTSGSLEGTIEGGNGVVSGSINGGGTWEEKETYDIGAYRMSDGTTIYLRCDDYTAAD